jgi:hypothetical protein
MWSWTILGGDIGTLSSFPTRALFISTLMRTIRHRQGHTTPVIMMLTRTHTSSGIPPQ